MSAAHQEENGGVRKLAEGDPRATERHLRAVLASLPVIVAAFDREGILTLFRGGSLDELRPGADEWVGTSVFEMVSERPELAESIRSALAGVPVTQAVMVDGRTFEARYMPLRDESEEIVGAIAVAEDITERRGAEEALRESEEKYRDLLENTSDLIQSVGPDGEFLYVNPVWRETLGYSEAEVAGLSIYDVVPARMLEGVRAARERVLAGGEPGQVEMTLVARDGREIQVSGTVNCKFVHGKPVLTRGTFRDVTERRRATATLRQSEERYRELFENANDIVYTTDLAGNFTSMNRAGETHTGYPLAKMLSMHMSQLIAPEFLAIAQDMMARKMAGETSRTTYEIEIVASDGRRVPLEVSSRIIYEEGEPVAVQGLARQISERKQAEELFRTVANSSPVGIFIVQDGVFEFVNPEFQKVTGYDGAELIGTDPLLLVLSDDRPSVRRNAVKMLRGEKSQAYEYRSRNKEGGLLWLMETVTPITYRGRRATLGNHVDISERKRIEALLERQAFYDSLTGLPNRAYFMDRLEEALARAERQHRSVALMFLDLDGFKAVNDSHGHAAGDQVLAMVGERLRSWTRPFDTVARMGGDEFTILLESVDARQDAAAIAWRIIDGLGEPFNAGEVEARVSASIGIAVSGEGSRAGDLLRQADIALYHAKANGKARYSTFHKDMAAAA